MEQEFASVLLENAVTSLSRLPGVGRKTALRFALHLLRRDEEEVTGLQKCIQSLVNKQLKLVNVVQVMLICRILPCQQRAFNLWEFNPAQHRTLSRLFDTTYEDAWKVLFKGTEAPASATEDRGFSMQCHARAVSCFHLLQDISFS